jgi:hypothetical protein
MPASACLAYTEGCTHDGGMESVCIRQLFEAAGVSRKTLNTSLVRPGDYQSKPMSNRAPAAF